MKKKWSPKCILSHCDPLGFDSPGTYMAIGTMDAILPCFVSKRHLLAHAVVTNDLWITGIIANWNVLFLEKISVHSTCDYSMFTLPSLKEQSARKIKCLVQKFQGCHSKFPDISLTLIIFQTLLTASYLP